MSTIREWLLEHRYPDIVRKIENVEQRWTEQGKKTRRNWWDVLAGNMDGEAKVVEGVKFPVLEAARERKGWKKTPKTLKRTSDEIPLPIQEQARWHPNDPKHS